MKSVYSSLLFQLPHHWSRISVLKINLVIKNELLKGKYYGKYMLQSMKGESGE
jgi:hypothetical protein